jgi:hypothetical protein
LEAQRIEAEKQAMELKLQESQIAIMLSQIQPHFLYNTLNSIYQLCEMNPMRARSMVNFFAEYLRNNLSSLEEPGLISFETELSHIKTYLEIPNVMKYVNNTWVMVDNPADCEARLESIEDYFKGNFKELKEIIKLQPNNRVKVLFGVRTVEDKMYQAVYTQMFLKNSITDYSKLDKDLQERKAAGAYPTTEFTVGALKEYTVEATDFSKEIGEAPSSPWNFQ